MNVCIVGTGYVGLVCGACFAEMGNMVICIDTDAQKVANLKDGIISIYEPGLEEIVKSNMAAGRLSFSQNIEDGVPTSQFIFIAVGTPSDEDGTADLKHVLAVARAIGRVMTPDKIIVNKSTVPLGTAALVRETIQAALLQRGHAHMPFDVVSNPEFLKEGNAVQDFMRPDRIVVGTGKEESMLAMKELYAQFIRNGHPFLAMDTSSAELTKYAANAMLATRISFMNEIAQLCDKSGADIEQVRMGIGTDSRIGMSFLYAGIGYGGSCFPKDVRALQQTLKAHDQPGAILTAVEQVNKKQAATFCQKIATHFGGDLRGKKIAVWGLSFKPKTDDLRESASLRVVEFLLEHGAKVSCFDPVAMKEVARRYDSMALLFANDMYQAVQGAHALVLATEWNEFRNPDFDKLRDALLAPVIFDGRNQYNPQKLRDQGWTYVCVGR